MLEKKVPFLYRPLVATTHRDRLIDLVTKLATTADCYAYRPHRALHL